MPKIGPGLKALDERPFAGETHLILEAGVEISTTTYARGRPKGAPMTLTRGPRLEHPNFLHLSNRHCGG